MPFPTALPSSAVDTLAITQFGTDCYLLVWGQNIVMKARVNQSSFANTFATITIDTITEGSAAAALEGYTVWISSTDDIRAYKWWGRLRAVATATLLSVEWTSFQPADDDFVFITKDVRPSTKTPFLSGSSWLTDFDISYHDPPPIIYNVPTFFFKIIDADGNADISITPAAYAIADGAAISSWALTSTDGGTQVSFNGSTGAAVIRYNTPGDYMPRLTVTDDNGTTQFFTPFVKIEDANLSSVVNLTFSDISISAAIDGGWNMTMPFWDGVQTTLDGSMCAVYMPHKTSGNKLLFCGRIRNESSDYSAAGSGTATFLVDGLANVMNNLNAISWRYKDEASPTDFAELTNATPWRAIGTYIREMTNLNNTHSLEFDDTSDDYVYISYFFQKGTLLDSLRGQMWSVNMDFEFTSDGMFKLIRNMRYIPTADRSALTTIADFEFKHLMADSLADIIYSLEKDHSFQVGKAIMGNGYYNTTSKKPTFFAALSPPVQQARGTEQSVTDRQILKANLSQSDAETEGKQRVRNDFAAKQFLDTINVLLPGAFLGKFNPSVAQLYTFTITVSDGIRLLTYTSSDKWLMTELSTDYDIVNGRIVLPATFQIESDDLGFAIGIRNPLPLTFYPNPVMMPQPSMPTFDYDATIDLPTGAQEGDEQPVNQQDTNPVDGAQDPSTMVVFNNSTLVCWSETRSQMTREFGNPVATWFAIEPGVLPSGHKIQMFDWNRSEDGGTGGYLIAHNDTIADPDSRVYYRRNVGSMEEWSEATLTDMLATMVNVTGKTDVIVYGKFEQFVSGNWTINRLNGNGNDDLFPFTPDIAYPPLSQAPGVYNVTEDRYDGILSVSGSTNDGTPCDVVFPIPPGSTVDRVTPVVFGERNNTSTHGDRNCAVFYDDGSTIVRIGSGHAFGSGFYGASVATSPQSISMNKGPGLALTDGQIIVHCSMDKRPSFGGGCWLGSLVIIGSSLADFVGTRFSDDRGEIFEGPKSVGLMSLGDGSMTRRKGQRVLAAKDENVKRAPLAGQPFLFNADQGTGVGAGQFATALLKFGTDDDYLIAPDGGAVGLYKVVNNVITDITPNDGANDGFAVGPGALAMTSIDDDFVWFLGNFGGSVKLAYSTDLGTSWNFNGDPTSNATWVTANPRSSTMIYISDGSTILQSLDGGATLTSHTSPIANLTGVAAL